MITQDRLKELLRYDPETGFFTWVAPTNSRLSKGSIAGHKQKDGYIVIKLDGKSYRAHRLAFLYIDGIFPEVWVDHINGSRNDNRFSNFRKASISENMFNAGLAKTNKSGIKGVYCNANEGKWKAQIRANGSVHHIGTFTDIQEASAAVSKYRAMLHGEFANHGERPSYDAAMRAEREGS